MVEIVVGYAAKKILDQVTKLTLDAVGDPAAERVKRWVRGDPRETALALALVNTLTKFRAAYHVWYDDAFDANFLARGGAPLLARTITRTGGEVTAVELAQAWAMHVGGKTGPRHVSDAVPVAQQFLDWWRDELNTSPVFETALDSKALERISAGVEMTAPAIADLHDALDRAAHSLEEAVLSTRYPDLSDYVVWECLQQVRDAWTFVGREWVFAELEQTRSAHPSGYIRIVGEAGLGKTALAAAIAARYDAPAYFFNEAAGRVQPEACLNHLSVELIGRYALREHAHLPVHAGENASFIARLLATAVASADEQVLIVIDGLDETLPTTGTRPRLPLPQRLPDGVFVVLCHRPGSFPLSGSAIRELTISADTDLQRRDVVTYLRRRVADPDVSARLAGAQGTLTPTQFVRRLADASAGNFMYVSYAISELLSSGAAAPPNSALPRGLTNYYQRMWDGMREAAGHDRRLWTELQRPVISLLAVAGEPVELQWVSKLLGKPAIDVQDQALRAWQPFLQHTGSETRRWRIVHQSFREFLADTNELDLRTAHQAVADHYGDPARWAADDGYAMRHLSSHLLAAGDHTALVSLVDDARWADAQRHSDNSGLAYLTDLRNASAAVSEVDAAAIAAGSAPPLLLREILLAIAVAQQSTVLNDLPALLVAQLVAAGRLSPDAAFAIVERAGDAFTRSDAYAVLVPFLDADDRARAVEAALAEADGRSHLDAFLLANLCLRLPDPERAQADAAVRAAAERLSASDQDEIREFLHARAEAVDAPTLPLAPFLSSDLDPVYEGLDDVPAESRAIERLLPQAAQTIADVLVLAGLGVDCGSHVLAAIAPQVDRACRDALLADAQRAGVVVDADARLRALAGLAQHLPEPHRGAVLDAAMSLARVPHTLPRAQILSRFCLHLPEPDRAEACAAALDDVRAIEDRETRLSAYVELVTWLPEPQRSTAHEEAASWATANIPRPAADVLERLDSALSTPRPTSERTPLFGGLIRLFLGAFFAEGSANDATPDDSGVHSPEAVRLAKPFKGRDRQRVLTALAEELPRVRRGRLHEVFDDAVQDAAGGGVRKLKEQALALGVLLEHVWSSDPPGDVTST
jgi:hypothetical protein